MTVESITTMELGDVLAVRYECSNCGAVLSVPIETEKPVPDSCPTCKAQWFSSMSMTAQQQVFEMLHHLREVRKWTSGKGKLPLNVEFEIASLGQ